MNDKKLYIPFGLNLEPQIWDGFGRKQLPQFFIGAGVSLAACVVLTLLINILIGLSVLIGGCFATVMIVTKQEKINLSVIDFIVLLVRKNKEQQVFRYVYKDDYGL